MLSRKTLFYYSPIVIMFLGLTAALTTFIDFTSDHPSTVMIFISAMLAWFGINNQKQMSREKNSLDFEAAYKRNTDIVESFRNVVKIAGLSEQGILPVQLYATDRLLRTSSDHHDINTILNEWERVANAINHGIYDEDFLYGVYGSTVVILFKSFLPFIIERQKNNPKFFKSFVGLGAKWCARKERENSNAKRNDLLVALEIVDTILKKQP